MMDSYIRARNIEREQDIAILHAVRRILWDCEIASDESVKMDDKTVLIVRMVSFEK